MAQGSHLKAVDHNSSPRGPLCLISRSMTSLSEHTRSSSPLVLLPPAWPDLKSLAQCLLNCPLLCHTLIDSFIAARRVLFTPVWSHLPFVENPPGALPSLRFNCDPQVPAQLVLRPPDLSHHPHPHSPAPAPLVAHLRAFAPAVWKTPSLPLTLFSEALPGHVSKSPPPYYSPPPLL